MRAVRRLLTGLVLFGVLTGADNGDLAPVHLITDNYFGTLLIDPYRYMETGGSEFDRWKARQLALTSTMLKKARAYATFGNGVATLERPDWLTLANGRAFYVRSVAGSDRIVESRFDGSHAHTILDSKRYSTPKFPATFGAIAVSKDGTKLAMHVYTTGTFNSHIHVVRIDGRELETLKDTTYDDIDFTPDSRWVSYVQAPPSSDNAAISATAFDYLHRIGTSQRKDVRILGPGTSPRVPVPPHSFVFVDPNEGTQAVAEVRDVGERLHRNGW